jgi:transglutaminase-like putative cysteine protease
MRSINRTAVLLLCLVFPATAVSEPARDPAGLSVSFSLKFKIIADANTAGFTMNCLLPKTIPGRQKILGIKYSLEPAEVFEKDGDLYAQFYLAKPKQVTDISIDVEAELYAADFGTVSTQGTTQLFEKKADLKKYLIHETYLERHHHAIVEAAKKLAGKNEEETIRNTMAFVVKTMKQGPYDGDDHGAVWALQKKIGDCTEFSDLFVTLCRANNIPARFCQGYVIGKAARNDTLKHDRAEVYTGKYGWVYFDPFHVHLGNATFEKLPPVYVVLDHQRHNGVINNYHFWAYWCDAGKATVNEDFIIHKQNPLKEK